MTVRLTVKVVPGSSQNRIVGMYGDALKVRVQAPPEKGKANDAVIKLMANFLGVPASSLMLYSGGTSKTKIFEIQGLSQGELDARVAALSEAER